MVHVLVNNNISGNKGNGKMSTTIIAKKTQSIQILGYSGQAVTSCEGQNVEEILSRIEPNSINWINGVYHKNTGMVARILSQFQVDLEVWAFHEVHGCKRKGTVHGRRCVTESGYACSGA